MHENKVASYRTIFCVYKLMKVNLTEQSTFAGNGAMLIFASDVIAFAMCARSETFGGKEFYCQRACYVKFNQ